MVRSRQGLGLVVAGIRTLVLTGLSQLALLCVLLLQAQYWAISLWGVLAVTCFWLTLGTGIRIMGTCRGLWCHLVRKWLKVRSLGYPVTPGTVLARTCTLKPGLVVSR